MNLETEAPGPDVKGAVADARELVRDRRTGRMRPPKGPGGRGKRGATKAALELVDDEAPAPPTDAEVADATGLGRTVWDIAGPMVGFHSLNDEQAGRLGRALAPIVKKYAESLSGWWAEVTLGLTVIALARETRITRRTPTPEADSPTAVPYGYTEAQAPEDDPRMRVR